MARTIPPKFKLTPEAKKRLEENLTFITEVEDRIQSMREANIDVTKHVERMRNLRAQNEGILRVFS